MFKKTPLASAIGSITLASALATVGATLPAFAEEAADAAMEEVIVTGSRIKRADLEGASPVTVLTREEMQLTGMVDVGDLLQRMPSMSGSPIGTTTNNGGNGDVNINLRGLGAIRTLTLINGKRTVDGGDFQTIPATLIERVEILKDGASAVYGADAVAGVVNIITRQDFEGMDLSYQTADFFDMDSGAQDTYSFIAGKNFDGGNFTFGAEYVSQEAAYQSDAPWDYFQNSYFIYPAGCESNVTAPYTGYAGGGCYVAGSSRIPESRLKSSELAQRFYSDLTPRLYDPVNNVLNRNRDPADDLLFVLANGVPTFSNPFIYMNEGAGIVDFDGRTYNYAPVNFIQTPYERSNFFAAINYDLTDSIKLNADVRYSKRRSEQELAPQPYNSPSDPAYMGTYIPQDPITGFALREHQIVNSLGDTVWAYTGDQGLGRPVSIAYSGISPDNYYNTLGLPIIDARRRMVETTRSFEQDVSQLQVNLALSGELNEISWDVFYNKGYRDQKDGDFGQFSGARLANAMGPSADLIDLDGIPECYTNIADASTLIEGCVPMNFFGGPGALTQEMIDYVSVDLVDTRTSVQDQGGFSIAGGGFELPGGEMGWAAGYEYRKEQYTYLPDSGKQTGAVTGNTGAGTRGGYQSDSFFGELFLPVWGNGTQSVDITLGLRSDDFDTFGSDTTFQAGVEVQVLEALKLRATVGEVFRAPSISESYAGEVDSFPQYTDPCDSRGVLAPGCTGSTVPTDSQVLSRVGGNPDLVPETGDTSTIGVVWTPKFGFGDLSLTVDYWETDLEDMIDTLGVSYILNDCYVDLNASSCSLIYRRTDYSIDHIVDINRNTAKASARGIDTEVRFGWETGFGNFEASLLWAKLLERERRAFPGDGVEELEGTYKGSAYAEDKINYSLTWNRGDLTVGYLGEYISELDGEVTFADYLPAGYKQKIDSQLYHDIVVNYNIPDIGLEVAAGITNVTDEEPPYIDFGFNASTDPSTYRLFGQGYYLRLKYSL